MKPNANLSRIMSASLAVLMALLVVACSAESDATTLEPTTPAAPAPTTTSQPAADPTEIPTSVPTSTPEPTPTPATEPAETPEPTKASATPDRSLVALPNLREGGIYDYPASGLEAIGDQDLAQALYTAIEYANATLELDRDQIESNDRLLAVRPQVHPELIEQDLAFMDGDPDTYGFTDPASRYVDLRLQYGPDGELFVILCEHFVGSSLNRQTGEVTFPEEGTVERVLTFRNEGQWLMIGSDSRHGELDVFNDCPLIDTPYEARP